MKHNLGSITLEWQSGVYMASAECSCGENISGAGSKISEARDDILDEFDEHRREDKE